MELKKGKAKLFNFGLPMLSTRTLLQIVLYGIFFFLFQHQTLHSIRKLSPLVPKCCVTGSEFLTLSLSVYNQNGTCLPIQNGPLVFE